jgi:hypothetical protein
MDLSYKAFFFGQSQTILVIASFHDYVRGGWENNRKDPMRIHRVKRKSILYKLEYWKVQFQYVLMWTPNVETAGWISVVFMDSQTSYD